MKNLSNMRLCAFYFFLSVVPVMTVSDNLLAQNPIIMDQFTADPSARVFGDSVYLYPSHDILAKEGRGRFGWFCMEDYHVFSSGNLTAWRDHGVILSQDSVPWVNSEAYAMWAPDCICVNGKYYFYFPALAKDSTYGRGFSIGIAISEEPYGPFIPQPDPMKGVHGIDPSPFIDNDGQAYLYWAGRGTFYVAKLKKNMLELSSEPQVIQGLSEKGLKEGPFAFERNGVYYLVYPHVADSTERLEYATANGPLGPFNVRGVVMDEIPGCWTNQASVIEFRDQWYLFYHHNDLSPQFDKNRSVRADSLFFNEDGTIRKVIPTLRGVGVTDASQEIQIDRYSFKSNGGASVAFLDTLDTFEGWKTTFDSTGAWIQYNSVDFGNSNSKSVDVRASSGTGGTLEIKLDNVDGPVVARVDVPEVNGWEVVKSPVSDFQPGIHNLIVQLKSRNIVEVDWISFK
jgi:hypothetical protein